MGSGQGVEWSLGVYKRLPERGGISTFHPQWRERSGNNHKNERFTKAIVHDVIKATSFHQRPGKRSGTHLDTSPTKKEG